jgi:hypothetical protein
MIVRERERPDPEDLRTEGGEKEESGGDALSRRHA